MRARRVLRAAGVYVAAAFVVLQLGEIVLPAFSAPDWALQTLVVFAFLGLPLVLTFSWFYDVTLEGVARAPEERAGGGTFLAWTSLLIVALACGVAAVLWVRSGSVDAGLQEPSAAFEEMAGALEDDDEIRAIAVLPLEHLAEGDDLFARQLHAEVVTQLSRRTSLRVVSRTSVQRYSGTDLLIPAIARELRVQAIVTGSVSMTPDSDSVRIAVQLVHGPSDALIRAWTFQREMTQLLRLQAEVAQEIAVTIQGEMAGQRIADGSSGEMDPSRTLARIDSISEFPPVDPSAFRAYARGMELLEEDDRAAEARNYFLMALSEDSLYAPAWAGLAEARFVDALASAQDAADLVDRLTDLGTEIAERAARWEGYEELYKELVYPLELERGALLYAQGVEPDAAGAGWEPPDSLALALARTTEPGRRIQGAVDGWTRRRARGGSEGEASASVFFEIRRLLLAERYRDARRLARELLDEEPRRVEGWIALEAAGVALEDYEVVVDARAGRLAAVARDSSEAAREIRALLETVDPETPASYWHWLRNRLAREREGGGRGNPFEEAMAALGVGMPGEALAHLERAVESRDPRLAALMSNRFWDPLRREPRFRAIVRRIGAAGSPEGGRRLEVGDGANRPGA